MFSVLFNLFNDSSHEKTELLLKFFISLFDVIKQYYIPYIKGVLSIIIKKYNHHFHTCLSIISEMINLLNDNIMEYISPIEQIVSNVLLDQNPDNFERIIEVFIFIYRY